jgi:hypothetical protein
VAARVKSGGLRLTDGAVLMRVTTGKPSGYGSATRRVE